MPRFFFHIYDDASVTFGTEAGTALLSDPQRVASFAATFAELEHLAVYDEVARDLLEPHRRRLPLSRILGRWPGCCTATQQQRHAVTTWLSRSVAMRHRD